MTRSATAILPFTDGPDSSAPLLALDEPPPYGVVNPDGTSPYLLLCEHASPRIPRILGDLGVPEAERMRHIGWDIGAQALGLHLAHALDAALFSAGYSRLVVDCNRPEGNPSLMPEVSESTPVPGNRDLSDAARAARMEALFHPFQAAVSRRLDLRQAAGLRTLVVGVHSYTPVFKDVERPWHAGILYGEARAFGTGLLHELAKEPDLILGDNEPYRIDADDYTVPVHGDRRGLPALLIEVRNDLIDTPAGVAEWGERLARCLLATERAMT